MSLPTTPERSAAFHLLAKPTGAVCNFDCSYCFLSKEMLYPGSRGKGSFDQVKVMSGLDFLRDGAVEWNALTTVHAVNVDHGPEVTASCATSAARSSCSTGFSSSTCSRSGCATRSSSLAAMETTARQPMRKD